MKNKLRTCAALLLVCVCMGGFSVTAYAGGPDYEEPVEAVTDNPMTEAEEKEPAPLTPDGNGTVVDNVTDEDGKEFYTVVTPDEHIFFLVIDKQRDADNVYFLDYVTEKDLLSLTVEGEDQEATPVEPVTETCICTNQCVAGEVNTSCPVCKNDLSKCKGKAVEPVTENAPEPEKPKNNGGGNVGTFLLIGLVALAAGGAGYYFKVLKPKKELDAADDFDDIEFLDGPEVNEDDLPEPEGYELLEDDDGPGEGDEE